jgi:GNAT superfamily N-acetyltransferase
MFLIVPCGIKRSARDALMAELKECFVLGAEVDGFDVSKHMPLVCFAEGEEGYFFITQREQDVVERVCVGCLEWDQKERFLRIFVAPSFRRKGAATEAIRFVETLIEEDMIVEGIYISKINFVLFF